MRIAVGRSHFTDAAQCPYRDWLETTMTLTNSSILKNWNVFFCEEKKSDAWLGNFIRFDRFNWIRWNLIWSPFENGRHVPRNLNHRKSKKKLKGFSFKRNKLRIASVVRQHIIRITLQQNAAIYVKEENERQRQSNRETWWNLDYICLWSSAHASK